MQVGIVEGARLGMWQDFVDAHPSACGPYHHAGWHSILRECFAVEPLYLAASDNGGRVTGILPLYGSNSLLLGRHLATLSGGAVADDQETVEALYREAFRQRDSHRAAFLYAKEGRFPQLAPTLTSEAVSTRLTIKRDALAWREELPRKTRKAIRLAEEAAYVVRRDDDAVEEFYSVYAENMRDLGTPVTTRRMFHSMRQHLSRFFRLYIVKGKGQTVGGLLCINGVTAWYPLYASVLDAYKPHYPNYLLYWTAMADAAALPEVQFFDMGRSTIGSGNHFFKQKWHGKDLPVLHAYFAAPGRRIDPSIASMRTELSLKQKMWSRLPLAVTNRLGPVLRNRMPFA